MDNIFYNTMKKYTDEQYLELLCRAEHEPEIDGVRMPGFPDTQFQLNTVGYSGETALSIEGFSFYKYVKGQVRTFAKGVNKDSVILDFGCGWGRMIRFYFKDIKTENIFGIDVDPKMVKVCQETLPCGNYSVTTPAPPTKFDSEAFDVIFAYSVFSHLRYDIALDWIKEFSRILKPGGIVVLTTRKLSFLDECDSFRTNPDKIENEHHEILSRTFTPIDEYRKRYLNGEFLYGGVGGGGVLDYSFYGEAVIPSQYILKEWAPFLAVKNIDDSSLQQLAVTMQSKAFVNSTSRKITIPHRFFKTSTN